MLDFINNVDDGHGNVSFDGFCSILTELQKETDTEAEFKNAFRAFYKDEEGNNAGDGGDCGDGGDTPGCLAAGNIPAEEMRFVLSNLPGGLTAREVDRMINTVDRNKDGRIRWANFHVTFIQSQELYFPFNR